MSKTPIQAAIEVVGTRQIAEACRVSSQAVLKWAAKGRLPRTEWTGETNYSATIEVLTAGKVTRSQLLSMPRQEAP